MKWKVQWENIYIYFELPHYWNAFLIIHNIHNIVWRRTHLLAVTICSIWYRYLCIILYYIDIELQDCNASVVHFCVILDNRSAVGVMAHNTWDSRLWFTHNETRSGGYLSYGGEGIGGKELWLWLPEVHEPRHGGERDCCPRLSPAWAPLPAAEGPPPRDHRRGNPLLGAARCRRRWCLSADRCPLPRRWWSLGSEAPAGDNRGQQFLSPPCRGSVYFRLIWTWKNQRRLRTRCSRLRFSSGGAHSFWLW